LSELKLNFPVRGFDVAVKSTEGEKATCQSREGSFRKEERFIKFWWVSETIQKCVKCTGGCLVKWLALQYGGKKRQKMTPTLGIWPRHQAMHRISSRFCIWCHPGFVFVCRHLLLSV